jgi:ribonuclease R
MGGAMHRDFVVVVPVVRTSRGVEGRIVRILKRGNERVAGVLRVRGRSAWLEPDDTRLRGPVMLVEAGEGKNGDAAVARITRFPEQPRELPEGALEAVLGNPGDPNVEVAKILLREAIEEPHPAEAVAEAEAYGPRVPAEALEGREDLTHLALPTIDPEDARDHDDAVWAQRESDGSYTVWIAIADVSYYVRPGTALDAAANGRGCSIYLPDRAIPMLPRALSSNLCSLLPNEIRLCMCVEAKLDPAGIVSSYRVFEGFMRSAAKLTYGGVARALRFSSLPPESPEAESMRDELALLHELATILRGRRLRRGALDFDLPEPKIVLEKDAGVPLSVEKRAEDPGVKKAYQLIEEMMLLANELIAQYLTERSVPAIYRVHGAPDERKLERFTAMSQTLGQPFDVEDAKDPKKLSRFLKKVAKHPSHNVFNMLLLRAMKQAAYDTENIGHFGLASSAYLHFTSPIRRYPDLVVHRVLRDVLRRARSEKAEKKEKSESAGKKAVEAMKEAATHASDRERHAMDVEREVTDLYRTLYMQRHIGESFEGTVTGLVGSGIFVQLDSPFVDVLVRFESLGSDEYRLDDDELRVYGVRSGDVIALGDRMQVFIEDVAILRRTIYGRREGGSAERRADREGAGERRPTKARGMDGFRAKSHPKADRKGPKKKAARAFSPPRRAERSGGAKKRGAKKKRR